MTASTAFAEAPWRAKLQAGLTLFVALAGTALGLAVIYFDARNSAELRAYRSSGECTNAAAALGTETCRYTGTATVVTTTQQSTLAVTLAFSTLPGHTFVATFPSDREPDLSALETGASAPAELWNGEVTKYAGVKSVQDPEFLPQNIAAIGGLLVAVGTGLIVWAFALVRRAWRRR